MSGHELLLGLSVAASAIGYIASTRNNNNKNNTMSRIADPIADVPEYIRTHKYPAKAHNATVRSHLAAAFQEKAAEVDSAAFLVAGNNVEPNKYCDTFKQFRQERYFFYLSGVDIPGAALFYECKTQTLSLFLPEIDWDDVVWGGMPTEPKEALEKYDVDAVYYMSELNSVLSQQRDNYNCLYTTDCDNFAPLKLAPEFQDLVVPGDAQFFLALDESRLIKDQYEIEILRHVARITDNAHVAVMSALPIEINELHLEAEFSYHAKRQGARTLGYDPICCSGPACGTLHYVKNSESLAHKQSTLIDAGAEWMNYVSDVTRCFPLSGTYTKEHRAIYDAVRDMQAQTMALMKPGASWEQLHELSHRILIKHLRQLGILRANEFSEEQMFESRVSCAFYPHGLGHLMGLDVHDVGGRPNYADPDPYFQYLRLRRPLQCGMVLTNEPGCYFNEHLVDEFLKKHPERAKMVDFDVMERYKHVGGVRIEDDILITKEGYENLTGVTSDPAEVEKIVQAGLKKGRAAFHAVV